MEKEVYVTKTVDELLFEGYHDRILSVATKLKNWGFEVDKFLPAKFGWYFDVRISLFFHFDSTIGLSRYKVDHITRIIL